MIIIAFLAVFGLYYGARHFAGAIVAQYTQDHPLDLPVVKLPGDQMAELQKRLDAFSDAVKNGEAVEPLVLTANEVNALLQKNKDFSGKVHVTIEDGAISGKISFPLSAIKPDSKILQGRYLNGSARFLVTLANGMLYVNIDSLTVAGRQLPKQFVDGMRTENLAKDVTKDPDTMKFLGGLASIDVKQDTIILVPKNEAKGNTTTSTTSNKAN